MSIWENEKSKGGDHVSLEEKKENEIGGPNSTPVKLFISQGLPIYDNIISLLIEWVVRIKSYTESKGWGGVSGVEVEP